MGKELDSGYYDWVFTHSKTYNSNPEDTHYYPMWLSLAAIVNHLQPDFVIDLGCGPGQLAAVLAGQCHSPFVYLGMDFSAVAIARAKEITDRPNFVFEVKDLVNDDFVPSAAIGKKCLFIASEFLEHIEQDLEVMSRIPAGQHVAITVPRFNDEGHVRWFDSPEHAALRYESLVDIALKFTMPTNNHFLLFGIRKAVTSERG